MNDKLRTDGRRRVEGAQGTDDPLKVLEHGSKDLDPAPLRQCLHSLIGGGGGGVERKSEKTRARQKRLMMADVPWRGTGLVGSQGEPADGPAPVAWWRPRGD